MTDTVLSFRKVSFGYFASQPILKDVDFDLRPGRIAAILGPNGAGKTTLLSLTLGWLPAWTGEITLTGTPLRALPPRERGRRMALVPQAEHTPFDYTVLEYVLMGRAPHLPPLEMPSDTDAEIALNCLDQVGIAALAQRPVPQLSGGERQLLLLARALAQLAPTSHFPLSTFHSTPLPTSHLLLLDEPTAHLDLHNKARLIQIMRRLRDSGVTLLMTNHEPDVVLAVADDVLLMESGIPPQFGALDEVFTAEALSRVYGLPIRLVQVNGHKQVLWT
ncbi:MAG: ABC transporter ATP-binding protein [Chloroflexi bacterium]|nr:ABC transporter ATP-binding protein [Chloroflexota bacterium]NOG74960.1 ABC transporter ATP-binding protein [Chloroflexota bacterium]